MKPCAIVAVLTCSIVFSTAGAVAQERRNALGLVMEAVGAKPSVQ